MSGCRCLGTETPADSTPECSPMKLHGPPFLGVSVQRTAPQNVTVTINAKGVFYLNDKQLSEQNANGLRQQLSAVIEQDETARVLIKADANAPHKFVVTALDVVGQLGIEGVSIATTEARN